MTAEKAIEYALRIQAESEKEAAKLVLQIAKEQWTEGYEQAEMIAFKVHDKLYHTLKK